MVEKIKPLPSLTCQFEITLTNFFFKEIKTLVQTWFGKRTHHLSLRLQIH